MKRIYFLAVVCLLISSFSMFGWEGMEMPRLHVEGRWLVDKNGNKVNLHGFGQTYSPWFNEQGKRWSDYNVDACLAYNKKILDGVTNAGWKMTYLRLHMDPYWSNTPGVQTTGENDISAYNYLICEIESPVNCGLSLRLFDTDNYWTDPVMADFHDSTRVVIDLKNMKSNEGRKLDPSHIYIAGFWTLGGKEFKIKSIFPSNDPEAQAGVEMPVNDMESVDVSDSRGILVRRGVAKENSTVNLPDGIYIIGGKKVLVKN